MPTFEVGRSRNPTNRRAFDHASSRVAEDTNGDGITDTARPSDAALSAYEARLQTFAQKAAAEAPKVLRGLNRRLWWVPGFLREWTNAASHSAGGDIFRSSNQWTKPSDWLAFARAFPAVGWARYSDQNRAFAELVVSAAGGIPTKPGTYVNQDNLDNPSQWTPARQSLYDQEQDAKKAADAAAAATPRTNPTIVAIALAGVAIAGALVARKLRRQRQEARS